MIKNNQLYIFSLVFFFTHCFFLLYGNNIIKVSGNDTLLACLIGVILDIILFIFSNIGIPCNIIVSAKITDK